MTEEGPIRIEFSKSAPLEDGFPPLDQNNYAATIFDIGLRKAKTSGNWMVEFTFVIPSENKRRMWRSYTLTNNALPYLQRTLSRFGYTAEELAIDWDGEKIEEMKERLVGQECTIKVSKSIDREWGDEKYDFYVNNVDDVFGPEYAGAEARGW